MRGNKLTTRDDTYRVISGSMQDGSAQYEITPNPRGQINVWSLRKNGRYYRVHSPMQGSRPLTVGYRRAYQDPSF